MHLATAHLYLGEFDKAEAGLYKVIEQHKISSWTERKVWDLYIQTFRRKAEQLARDHDPIRA